MNHAVVPTSEADTIHPFDSSSFWQKFKHGTVTLKSIRLHYVEGGSGAPVLLLPGTRIAIIGSPLIRTPWVP